MRVGKHSVFFKGLATGSLLMFQRVYMKHSWIWLLGMVSVVLVVWALLSALFKV